MRKIIEIKGVGPVMAVACSDKGYHSIEDIAEASVAGLSTVPGVGRIRAKELIDSAQMLLNDAPPSEIMPLKNGTDKDKAPGGNGSLANASVQLKKISAGSKKKKSKGKKDKNKKKVKNAKKSKGKKSDRKKDKKKLAKKEKKKSGKKSKKNKKSKKKNKKKS